MLCLSRTFSSLQSHLNTCPISTTSFWAVPWGSCSSSVFSIQQPEIHCSNPSWILLLLKTLPRLPVGLENLPCGVICTVSVFIFIESPRCFPHCVMIAQEQVAFSLSWDSRCSWRWEGRKKTVKVDISLQLFPGSHLSGLDWLLCSSRTSALAAIPVSCLPLSLLSCNPGSFLAVHSP